MRVVENDWLHLRGVDCDFNAHTIRQVGDDDDERNSALRARAVDLRSEGIPLHLVSDASAAANIAGDLGLCDEETLVEVATELGPA